MTYTNIIISCEDENITTITFNRPKAMNALNIELFSELAHALDDIEADDNIKVLILTGAGDRAFIAGADITELATFNELKAKSFSKTGAGIINRLQELDIPVIAAVNGFALGGGNEMALACDFIYASDTAKFGLPEITLGLIPGFGGTQRLPRTVGKNIAKEMIFTGKMLNANEAKNLGMVNAVFPQDQLMDEVLKTAKNIASRGKVSLRAAKHTVNMGLNVDLSTGLDIETDAFALCFASEDVKEGTSAFLEKRKPIFKGPIKE